MKTVKDKRCSITPIKTIFNEVTWRWQVNILSFEILKKYKPNKILPWSVFAHNLQIGLITIFDHWTSKMNTFSALVLGQVNLIKYDR